MLLKIIFFKRVKVFQVRSGSSLCHLTLHFQDVDTRVWRSEISDSVAEQGQGFLTPPHYALSTYSSLKEACTITPCLQRIFDATQRRRLAHFSCISKRDRHTSLEA